MVEIPNKPITRKEAYLAAMAGQNVDLPPYPITREEAYLNEIAKKGGGTSVVANPEDVAEDILHKVEIDGEIYSIPGGGGSTTDYLELDNKPQINGNELRGNKTSADLGLQGTLTFDNTPTDGSNNPVKSDGIYDSEKDIYAVMGEMGAKNLIPYPYFLGTLTINGTTFTLNGTAITVSSIPTKSTNYHILNNDFLTTTYKLLNNTKYKLTGCPTNLNQGNSYCLRLSLDIDRVESGGGLINDYGKGVEFTTPATGEVYCRIYIHVTTNATVNNEVFRPMLRLASDTDDTYQPYAKTNKQLTDEIATKVDKVTGKGLSTNDYTNTDKAEVAKVANKADKTATASGETLALVPTSEGRALLHTAYGMSLQNGTPTPSEPVDIESAKADFRSVGKNLLPYPYDYSSRPSLAGINYTINVDGSITMNGTTTGRTNYWLYDHGKGFMNLNGGDYILSKTGRTDFSLIVAFYKGSTWVKQVTATENDMTVSIDVNSNEYDNIGIAISFSNAGITVENVTVYPMLRLANVTDETYELYTKHETTTDLTLRAIEVTSSDAYNLVRDGKYYIADTLDYSEDNGWSVTRRIGHIASYDSESITTKWMSSKDVYASGTYPSTGAVVDYILTSENTETITTAQALALLGLKTYDESTTISSQAEPSCTVAVEYAKERLGALALTAYNTAKGNDLRITALEG